MSEIHATTFGHMSILIFVMYIVSFKHEHRPRVTVQYTCARPRDHHRIDHVDTWTPSHVGIKGHKKGISPNRHGRTADVLNLKGERGFVFFATEEIGASRSFVVRWRVRSFVRSFFVATCKTCLINTSETFCQHGLQPVKA